MSVTDKLDKVAVVARSAQSQAAVELKDRQQTLDRDSEQLSQLRKFKAEYESRLEQMAQSGMAARQLADYRRFLANLNQAIDQQLDTVAETAGEVENQRAEWMQKSLRTASLDDFLARRRMHAQQAADRIEQKLLDDHHAAHQVDRNA